MYECTFDRMVAYRDHIVAGLQDLQSSLVHQVGHLTVKQIITSGIKLIHVETLQTVKWTTKGPSGVKRLNKITEALLRTKRRLLFFKKTKATKRGTT